MTRHSYLRTAGTGPFPFPGEKRRLRKAEERVDKLLALLESLGEAEPTLGGPLGEDDFLPQNDVDPGPLDPTSKLSLEDDPGIPIEVDWEAMERFLGDESPMALARDIAVVLPTVSVELPGIDVWGYREVAQVSAELADEGKLANISVRLTPIEELRSGARRPKIIVRVAGQRHGQLVNSHGMAIFRKIPLTDVTFGDIELLWVPPKAISGM